MLPIKSPRNTHGIPDDCPNCGDTYNAVFPTSTAELSSPNDGKWCIWRGYFFIHEELRYPRQTPVSE